MTACLTEGNLRAFLDGELGPPQARFASEHLLSCSRCRNRLERLRTRAATIGAFMNRIEPDKAEFQPDCTGVVARIQSQAPSRRRGWMVRWVAAGAAGILALLLLSQTVRRPNQPEFAAPPKAVAPVSESGEQVSAPSLPVVDESTADLLAGNTTDYFFELDDGEPIQMGLVVRLSLPALVLSPGEPDRSAEEIQADVIVDEGGRPRAIRFPEIDVSALGKGQR